jgi:hypothetical protein
MAGIRRSDGAVGRAEPAASRAVGYQDLDMHLMTPEYMARSGMETTTSGELTPLWMQSVPDVPPPRARVVAAKAASIAG